MKKLFKKVNLTEKKGMTYVELLVALALLMVVIMAFTPMLLQSYSTIYDAGEREENTYNAKTTIEEQLASRFSSINYNDFAVRFKQVVQSGSDVIYEVTTKGKKITANTLETIFYNGVPSLTVISGNIVDDSTTHKIAIQTKNMDFKSNSVQAWTSDTAPTKAQLGEDKVFIQVRYPNKTSNVDASSHKILDATQIESAYTGKVTVTGITTDAASGLIQFTISGMDFTQSPIRIRAYYIGDTGNVTTVDTYVDVELPTLILGGDAASGADYYTTNGVKITRTKNAATDVVTEEYKMINPEARTLNCSTAQSISNSNEAYSIAKPSDVKLNGNAVDIKTIEYVNDTTVTKNGLKPFYVLTGTNGAIYRTYSFSKDDSFKNYVKYTKEGYFGVKSSDEAFATTYYPVFWSGDLTNQFYYDIYYTGKDTLINPQSYSVDYGGTNSDRKDDRCWITEQFTLPQILSKLEGHTLYKEGFTENAPYAHDGKGTQEFVTRAKYSYYRNGLISDFDFRIQSRRNISYILTEYGVALRLHGIKSDTDEFTGYQSVWNVNSGTDKSTKTSWENIYYCSGNKNSSLNYHNRMAEVAILSMNTGSLKQLLTDVDGTETIRNWMKANSRNYTDSTSVNVTGACYLPGLGQMFYLGSVGGNAYITQMNNSSTGGFMKAKYAEDSSADIHGSYTGYCVIGTTGSTGTTIYKASESTGDINAIATVGADPTFKTSGTIQRTFYVGNKQVSYKDQLIGYQYKHKDVGLQSSCWCDRSQYGSMSHIRDKMEYYTVEQFNTMKSKCSGIYKNDWKDWSERWTYRTVTEIDWDTASITQTTTGTDSSNYTAADSLTKSTNVKNINAANGKVNDEVNSFYIGMNATSLHLNDLYFTFGYASNREYVYSNVTYGIGQQENFKSYEKYYFLSHYGKSDRVPNYTVQYVENAPLTVQSHDYWNSADNDYYNVWFPGECYNLVKTAQMGGIVVSVGYAVSGSTYQWLDALAVSADTKNTSTALGGIFNDGVLAVCTDEATSFENKLYFKDNATMNTDFLTSSKNTATDDVWNTTQTNCVASAYSYRTAFKGDYGTHARQSVRFTAVDLGLYTVNTSDGNYYAYYGDSTGRLFYSLVATETNSKTTAVSYIADLTNANASTAPSRMVELKFADGKSLSTVFDEITTVTVKSYAASEETGDDNYNIVVISGKKAGSNTNYVVIAKISCDKSTKVLTVNSVRKVSFTDTAGSVIDIQDAIFINGYYYAVGTTTSGTGFFLAASEDDIESCITAATSTAHSFCTIKANVVTNDTTKNTTSTTQANLRPLYAIGGRSVD